MTIHKEKTVSVNLILDIINTIENEANNDLTKMTRLNADSEEFCNNLKMAYIGKICTISALRARLEELK